DQSGPDSQTAVLGPRRDEPTSSVAEPLFPEVAPAEDIAESGCEFLPALVGRIDNPSYTPGPAPKSLAGENIDMNCAAGRAEPAAPASFSLPGTANLAGPAPGAVAGDIGLIDAAASSPAMAYPLLQAGPTGHGGSGGGSHGGGGGGSPSGYSPA